MFLNHVTTTVYFSDEEKVEEPVSFEDLKRDKVIILSVGQKDFKFIIFK